MSHVFASFALCSTVWLHRSHGIKGALDVNRGMCLMILGLNSSLGAPRRCCACQVPYVSQLQCLHGRLACQPQSMTNQRCADEHATRQPYLQSAMRMSFLSAEEAVLRCTSTVIVAWQDLT